MWQVNDVVQGVNGSVARLAAGSFTAISTDSRTIRPGELFIPLKGPSFDGHRFIETALAAGAAGALCDRSRQDVCELACGTVVLVDDTNQALLDLAAWKRKRIRIRFRRHNREQRQDDDQGAARPSSQSGAFIVVANEKNYNNQIGVAKTMLAIEGRPDYAIFELGTNHRGEIRTLTGMVEPNISLITNVAPSHLEGLSDLAGVAEEKLDLFRTTRSRRDDIRQCGRPVACGV